jgi:hypothetical protein
MVVGPDQGPDELALSFLQVQVLLQVGEQDTGLRAGLHLEQDGAWGVHLPPSRDAQTHAGAIEQVARAGIDALRRAALTLEERLTTDGPANPEGDIHNY